jgi:uncharacterized membrane protein
MRPEHEAERDRSMEITIGNLLRAGVALAAAVGLLGAVLYFSGHGSEPTDFRTFHGVPPHLRSIHRIVGAALAGDSAAIMQLGLLLLVATPVVRVALSLVAFARHRDRLYVLVSAVVLSLLLFSLLTGIG